MDFDNTNDCMDAIIQTFENQLRQKKASEGAEGSSGDLDYDWRSLVDFFEAEYADVNC